MGSPWCGARKSSRHTARPGRVVARQDVLCATRTGTSSRLITAPPPEDRLAVSVAGLRREFGPTRALAGLDLEVRTGTVAVILGPNAAGKTTLLRILATLTLPDSGRAAVFGYDVVRDPDRVRERIGFVGDQSLLYGDLSALENLRYYARLYGLRSEDLRLEALLQSVGLWRRRLDRVRTYSRGMTQRLAIARAVLHDPRLLLLDEPHTGLDPTAADQLDDTLALLAGRGRTVLMATHDFERALSLADDVAIVTRGSVVWQGAGPALTTAGLRQIYRELAVRRPEQPRAASRPARLAPEPRAERAQAAATPEAAGSSGLATPVTTRPVQPVTFGGAVKAIVWKDLLRELHAREALPPVVVFSLLVVLIFHFAMPPDLADRAAVGPGALWVALLFGSTLGLSRAMAGEVVSGGLTGLLVSPADRGALFIGKWLVGYVFACLVAVPLVPAMLVLLDLPVVRLPGLFGVIGLGLIGWVATGTLLGAVAASTRAREVLLPVLLYPVVLPLVIPALQATAMLLGGRPWADLAAPLALVAAYDVIFLVLGFLLFSYAVEG